MKLEEVFPFHATVDQGALFARENLAIAEEEALRLGGFAHLVRVIRLEKRRIADVNKTGDLIAHYAKFASGGHKHSEDFLALSRASGGRFIAAEQMAGELIRRYPSEKDNRTEIRDFIPGKSYTSDFLGIVLGGSIATSFRNTRFSGVGYLMLNPEKAANRWQDNRNVLSFCPFGYQYRGNGAEGFIKRHSNKKVLVFEKTAKGAWLYFGIYKIQGQEGEYVILRREERYEGDKFWKDTEIDAPLITRSIKSPFPRKTDPKIAFLDILIQRANANCVEFSIKLLPEETKSNGGYLLSFPKGFYELFKLYEAVELIVTDRATPSQGKLVLSPQAYEDGDGVFGWRHLEDDIQHYTKVYYRHLLVDRPSRSWKSAGAELKIPNADERIAIVSLERFAISAIKTDIQKQRGDKSSIALLSPALRSADSASISHDLPIEGYYERIGVESPSFEFIYAKGNYYLRNRLAHLAKGDYRRRVFVNFAIDETKIIEIGGLSVLQLGIAFISQLGRLYPDLLAQYVAPDETDYVKPEVSDGESLLPKKRTKAEDSYAKAFENNKLHFKALVKETNKQIAIITGNGVSIPFGSSSWDKLSGALLKALKPKAISSLKRINDHFSNHTLLTTDFSRYALGVLEPNETHYWNLIKQSVYGGFQPEKLGKPSAVRSIANAKHKYKERILLFTYNYDTFLEEQYSHDFGETLISAHCPDSLLEVGREIIHLHGIIERGSDKGDGVTLTRSEYYEKYVKDSREPRFKRGMESLSISLRDRICLFVGSSMTDVFQMMMIQDASVQNEKADSNLIYALLSIKDYSQKEKDTIYRYYKRKNVFVIPFENFSDLPGAIDELFDV